MSDDLRADLGSGSPELEPVLDPERLQALRQLEAASGEEVLTQVVESFRDHSSQLLASLEEASSRGDLARLALDSHSLAGSAAALGGRRLAAVCRDLESAARRSALPTCRAALPRAAIELRCFVGQLFAAIDD